MAATKKELLEHLQQQEDAAVKDFAGKDNHNPFMFVRDKIEPLRREIQESEKVSEDLEKRVKSIKSYSEACATPRKRRSPSDLNPAISGKPVGQIKGEK